MTTQATVSGSIVIGDPKGSNIAIPVSATLPSPNGNALVFSYDLPPNTAPENTLDVGDFIKWVGSALGLPGIDLPGSLEKLNIGVSHLLIDTDGAFQIGALFGSGSGSTWKANWAPIDGLPLSFSNLEIEVNYQSKPLPLTTTAAAKSGDTTLVFASTLGLVDGMTVTGTGVATGATVIKFDATTVTLSAALTAAVASGATITFTLP
ncbi:hypothetical protein LZ199_33735 [Myxococcus sp. QH3KD-4-1]|nr:hypothetical protein [Myxococcus qinghaiensis]